ncbi:uncharacterized protein LALA0_S08e05380g [Lachancea lanzarotensis]|uniref:LALA0S08e05380g1_1 n=1 Tax=Lachancea lanzarotensis TaxID=1245769 RepID=A0A0C7MUS4_9SACH|nr:uncharacterized protein LALA0_S08e05380g [Lachancea lanzarotensis]CEP63560.1 LALA0S08e05380g1_1 [Lachancea lanzarotensis]
MAFTGQCFCRTQRKEDRRSTLSDGCRCSLSSSKVFPFPLLRCSLMHMYVEN